MSVSKGVIESLTTHDPDTMAARGSLDDGNTFDIPLPSNLHYAVGDEVLTRDGGDDPIEHDLRYIATNAHYATILYCEEVGTGSYKIIDYQIVSKNPEQAN